jgi:ABC-type dipeptide/oligopeptide/nickel transport system permease component
VIYKHGVRAAITPVVTQLGIDVGVLLAGAFVTERVFGLTGLGQLALNAIENSDLPVVAAAVVVLAASFIVVMTRSSTSSTPYSIRAYAWPDQPAVPQGPDQAD